MCHISHTVTPGLYKVSPLLNFLTPPGDVDILSGLMDWIVEDWEAKGETGRPSACVMAYEAATSRYSDHPLVFEMAEEKGINWMPHTFFPFTASDFTVELTRVIEEYGANYVYLRASGSPCAIIMKDAERLGYRDDAEWIICNFAPDSSFPAILGAANTEGIYVSDSHAGLPTDTGPGITWGIDLIDEYNPGMAHSNADLLGIRWCVLGHEVTKRCLEKYGLEGYTGTNLAEMMWTIEDLDFGGNGMPLTMEAGNIAIEHDVRLGIYHADGKVYAISDWIPAPWIIGNDEYDWRL